MCRKTLYYPPLFYSLELSKNTIALSKIWLLAYNVEKEFFGHSEILSYLQERNFILTFSYLPQSIFQTLPDSSSPPPSILYKNIVCFDWFLPLLENFSSHFWPNNGSSFTGIFTFTILSEIVSNWRNLCLLLENPILWL